MCPDWTPQWGLSFAYDGFGNRLSQNLTKGTGPTNATLVDANTNRISSFGYAYDANGNLTNMPQQNAQLSYDSSNRMTRFSDLNDAESYQYAPDNKRIWRSKGCSYYNQATGNNEPRPQVIFYSVFGQKLGEYCLTDNVTAVQEYVYFGGRMVAKTNIDGGPTLHSFKTDRLHSNQDAPGGGFFPYGETKSGAATTGESFATYSRDWHGLDYADQRWYAPGAGRFIASDPYMRSANTNDSASWNRFAYVSNEPNNFIDPWGLYAMAITFCITYETSYNDSSGTLQVKSWTNCHSATIESDTAELVPGPDHPKIKKLIEDCKEQVENDFSRFRTGLEAAKNSTIRALQDNTNRDYRNATFNYGVNLGLSLATGVAWGPAFAASTIIYVYSMLDALDKATTQTNTILRNYTNDLLRSDREQSSALYDCETKWKALFQ